MLPVFLELLEGLFLVIICIYNHKVQGIPSYGVGCFVVCCGNLACEVEGGTHFRDFSPSLFKNIIEYLANFQDFSAY